MSDNASSTSFKDLPHGSKFTCETFKEGTRTFKGDGIIFQKFASNKAYVIDSKASADTFGIGWMGESISFRVASKVTKI